MAKTVKSLGLFRNDITYAYANSTRQNPTDWYLADLAKQAILLRVDGEKNQDIFALVDRYYRFRRAESLRRILEYRRTLSRWKRGDKIRQEQKWLIRLRMFKDRVAEIVAKEQLRLTEKNRTVDIEKLLEIA